MKMVEQIQIKLTDAFSPARLEVLDESYRHEGHAGSRPGGETHFRVELVAAAFDGMARVARQRAVYQVLAEELAGTVHALELVTRSPDEDLSS